MLCHLVLPIKLVWRACILISSVWWPTQSTPHPADAARQPFGLIVADPPWENKSAQRAGAYGTLPSGDILRLPLRQLLHPRGLLALWVTNRRRVQRYLYQNILPAWGVSVVATW